MKTNSLGSFVRQQTELMSINLIRLPHSTACALVFAINKFACGLGYWLSPAPAPQLLLPPFHNSRAGARFDDVKYIQPVTLAEKLEIVGAGVQARRETYRRC